MLDSEKATPETTTTKEETRKKKPFHPTSIILHPYTLRLVGTALLIFFLTRLNLDFGKLWDELSQSNLWYIAASVALVFPFISLKAWRWRVILRDVGIDLAFSPAYRVYALGLAAGSFTPGQAGDFIKAWYLNKAGHSLGAALLSAVLDRLFDVAVLVLLAASGLLVLGADFSSVLPGLLALLFGVMLALIVLAVPSLRARLLSIALKMAGKKLLKNRNLEDKTAENRPASTTVSTINFVQIFGLTLLASGLALVRVWLLALALGLNLGLMETVAASSLATVV
ncbi:MAG: flippase-like domain-containing protein, partial [Cellulomonadaceae bacterium]|nr:flippase-like domain-containing protein [Cellulomonadaceae bacterium]